MAPIRVGIVAYLNSWPLAWAFLRGDYDAASLTPSYLPPAAVAEGLRHGSLDVGLVPSIELRRIPGLRIVSDLCIAATHEVRSVLLVCARPPADLRRVALDVNSRTSAALVRILLAERYGARPELVSAPPDLEAMLATADGALLIGDPALRVERRGRRVLDLAAEWRELTGHPFVFAVWAARPGVPLAPLAAALARSLELGLAELPAIVARAGRELALPPAVVHRYLTANLTYRLGPDERAGLAEFHRRAQAHGLVPEAGPAPAPRP